MTTDTPSAAKADRNEWLPIKYEYDEAAKSIVLPDAPPFDGKPVLLKAPGGVVEAWWFSGGWTEDTPISPAEYEGWMWICYDDAFQLELDDPTHWQPLPDPPEHTE